MLLHHLNALDQCFFFFFFFFGTAAGTTQGPQSVTVVVGGMATFQCTGPGAYLIWKINGETLEESSQNDEPFFVQRESNMGIWQSNLTVLTASAENNGTTVQCVLLAIPPNLPVSSDNATLTVLPGNMYVFV